MLLLALLLPTPVPPAFAVPVVPAHPVPQALAVPMVSNPEGTIGTKRADGTGAVEVWRCHKEVFALATGGARLFAATSGGVLVEENGAWKSLGPDSPTGIRKLAFTNGQLAATAFDGRIFGYRNGKWVYLEATPPTSEPRFAPPKDSGGTFYSTQAEGLFSFWNASHYYRRLTDGSWSKADARPPVQGDYCLLKRGTELLAGTNDGLWSRQGLQWTKVALPSALPLTRVHGFASFDGQYLVGGIDGLYLGKPNAWKLASPEPVRQILKDGDEAWVVYGSGAVDKLVPKLDRLYNDVLFQAVKRPWTSCVSLTDDGVLFGGQNTWVEKTEATLKESQGPSDTPGDVVTAIVADGSQLWFGTQKSGVFRVPKGRLLGTWGFNLGNGLSDSWVTCLIKWNDSILAGTSGAGLFGLRGKQVSEVPGPTQRVRAIETYKSRLVVGGMDGAWILNGKTWKALPTNGEETTSIVAGDRLVITTAAGVYFLP